MNHNSVLFENWVSFGHVTWHRAELLSLFTSAHNYCQAFNAMILNQCCEAVNA